MLPGNNLKRNGTILCTLSVTKYVIINLKINNFKIINQQQQILFAIFFSSINPDVHVNKQLYFIRGSGFGSPPETKELF